VLSICCLSGGSPARLAALLAVLRPVADELVVALDERVDPGGLGTAAGLCDVLVRYPFLPPIERPFGWLHSLCRGDWIFRIDDDEVPSAALLEALAHPDETTTHAFVPRRWLWQDGWLADDPWAPDWQLRLVRPAAAQHPGRMHIPARAAGPHVYLDAPLYHLDLAGTARAVREEKARRYERERPGLRLGGVALNIAYYVPELRDSLHVAPVPPADAAILRHVLDPPGPAVAPVPPPRLATREEVDSGWVEAPLPASGYAARIEPGAPPHPVAGEVRELDVAVTNLGTTTWPAGKDSLPEIRLAYRFEGIEAAGLRTPFPRPVSPGETVVVPLSFEAPEEPGAHMLVVDLVHERQRWFGCEQEVPIVVAPRRRAAILVGQPAGDDAFDARVDELLSSLRPELEPFLVGPKPDWLRDRFGIAASEELPEWAPDEVHSIPAGRRRDRLRMQLAARRLRRRAPR
jgi:hypothetical protein